MYQRSKKYKNIAERVISDHDELAFIKWNEIDIAYVESSKEKKENGKIVFADCSLVPQKYKWAVKADFMITVYKHNVFNFSRKQLEILMWHELSHIGINEDGNEPKPYIVPHDYEEFDKIVKEHGLRWSHG